MYEYDYICQRQKEIMHRVQRDRLVREIMHVQGKHRSVAPLRMVLIALINLVAR